jgi:hypothetical protein
MPIHPKTILQAIGIIAILCGAYGLYYNYTSFDVLFSGAFDTPETAREAPYFYPAFYVMSAACTASFVILVRIGIQFFPLQLEELSQFKWLMVFEVGYVIVIGLLWLAPEIGRSVAAATGVANEGLMIQVVILFPLWAPSLATWAAGKLQKLV